MSVLACDREGCDSIMCDYYSSSYGYLCWSCLDELKANNTGWESIADFMVSPPMSYSRGWVDMAIEEFKPRD